MEENSEDNTVLEVTLLTSVVLLKNLLILDGDPHGEYHKIAEDENRDKHLRTLGFTVLRFENRFVFQEPEYLKGEIRKVLNKKIEST
jgi:very-short-patch-repair endonuclease